MMKRIEHLSIDQTIFGRGYNDVHAWLDSDFPNWVNSPHSLYNHWLKYHHMDAVEQEWGVNTTEYRVARLHILCDWLSHFNEWHIPVSKLQCKALLVGKGVMLW